MGHSATRWGGWILPHPRSLAQLRFATCALKGKAVAAQARAQRAHCCVPLSLRGARRCPPGSEAPQPFFGAVWCPSAGAPPHPVAALPPLPAPVLGLLAGSPPAAFAPLRSLLWGQRALRARALRASMPPQG